MSAAARNDNGYIKWWQFWIIFIGLSGIFTTVAVCGVAQVSKINEQSRFRDKEISDCLNANLMTIKLDIAEIKAMLNPRKYEMPKM